MRLPRDTSSTELIQLLQKFAYQVIRHIRLTTYANGEYHITIPNHYSIRLGTLSSIINDISYHFKKTKEEIATAIFN